MEERKTAYVIPSMEHIRALYNEVIPLLKELKSKADVIEFGKKHNVTMEINYDLADLYSEDTPIEVIRCESWGDLDYIYVYPDDSKPMFDVWCDFSEEDFIDGINIDELEEAYKDGVKMLLRMNTTREDDLKEITDVLLQHGIGYDEMIDDYRLDKTVIEKWRALNENRDNKG